MGVTRAPGQEVRTLEDGTVLDPTLTGRGWCESCGEVTAAIGTDGLYLHRWCEAGTSLGVYLSRLPDRSRRGRAA